MNLIQPTTQGPRRCISHLHKSIAAQQGLDYLYCTKVHLTHAFTSACNAFSPSRWINA